MSEIDIHNYAQKIESVKNLVDKSRTSERNKELTRGLTIWDFPK